MYGLDQHMHTSVRIILVEKVISLILFKNACYCNLRSDPEHKTLHRFYRSWFNYQVVAPVSYNNTESVRLVEYVLGGSIVHLNDDSVKAVDYINKNYHPKYADILLSPMVVTTSSMVLLPSHFLSGAHLTASTS